MSENVLSLRLYKTPFSLAYWRTSARQLGDLRMLSLAAVFIALRALFSFLYVPLSPSLRVYFYFLVDGFGAMLYGPVVALFAGGLGDILGFIINPTGAYFPGYTLTAILVAFVNALFFYRTRISVVKIVLCKVVVNVFLYMGLNSLWNSIIYGKAFYVFLASSVVKNLVMLPLEIILLILLFRLMIPPLRRMRLVPPDLPEHISFI